MRKIMQNKRKKILIFGAGPAGLSAGVHLLEKGGKENLDVTIVNLDHLLGGKAKSWQDPVFNDGRFYDHGIHFVFGFYKNLRELMAKAGIKEKDVLVRWHDRSGLQPSQDVYISISTADFHEWGLLRWMDLI